MAKNTYCNARLRGPTGQALYWPLAEGHRDDGCWLQAFVSKRHVCNHETVLSGLLERVHIKRQRMH